MWRGNIFSCLSLRVSLLKAMQVGLSCLSVTICRDASGLNVSLVLVVLTEF